MTKRTLIIMIGVPGSGKSTFANMISDKYNIPIVSSDTIRKQLYGSESIQGNFNQVFNEVYRQINKWIDCGACIYDATNTKKMWRYTAIAKVLPTEVTYIIVDPGLRKSLEQNANRERVCPEHVIRRMHKQLKEEYPFEDECYNLKIFKYDDKALLDYLKGI